MSPLLSSSYDRLASALPSRRVILGQLNKSGDDPSVTSTAYDEMWIDWELIEDLCVGRDQMILKGRRWLPQEPQEENQAYLVRLYRSFLHGAFKDTVESIAAKPFSREVDLIREELLPEELFAIESNVDRQGTDITSFAKEAFKCALKYGHALCLIDYPSGASNLTMAQAAAEDIRPYWVLIPPTRLIGWRVTRIGNVETLDAVRILEETTEPIGRYGDRRIEQIREIVGPRDGVSGYVQLYRGADGSPTSWEPFGEPVTHTYPGVPVTWLPLNPTGKGLFRSTPPLKELSEVNLAHWQGSSDARNILRFVSVAMLLLTGVEQAKEGGDEQATGGGGTVKWGANQILTGPVGASGQYIEHSGAGYNAVKEYLNGLEERMRELGDAPYQALTVDVTATAQVRSDQKVTSAVQSWIRVLERFLTANFEASVRWVRPFEPLDVSKDAGFGVDVFNEFGLKVSSRGDGPLLLQTRTAGEISKETFLSEMKKRGIFGEELDIEEEMRRQFEEETQRAAIALPPDDDIDQNADPNADIDPNADPSGAEPNADPNADPSGDQSGNI